MAHLVLNVDDYEPQLYVRSAVLRSAGFDVVEARCGAEALALAREHRPSLVVLDVHLPDIDGLEVCRQIKGHPATARIPVLHVSATHVDAASRVRGLDNGADGYLLQSVAPEELVAHARSLLRLAEAERHARQAEEALRESTTLLRAISDTSRDVVFAKDVQGRMRFANPAALALIGKSLEDVLGKTDAEFLDNKEAARQVMENDRRIMDAGVGIEVEEMVPLPDGTTRLWLSQKMPYRDEAGKVVGLLGVSRDITERRREEAERDKLAQQRQLALNAARMGWWHYDPVTRRSSWDERYREIFGVSGDEGPNDPILARIDPADLPRVWQRVEAALDPVDPKPYAAEYRIHLPDGRVRWIEAHGRATFEGEGADRRATDLVGTVADITERKLAEERLQASETRYRALFENMAEGFALGEAILDEHGMPTGFRFIEVNAAFEQQSGLTREILDRPIREVLPRLESYWVERYCGVALTGTPIRFADYNADTGRHYDVFCYSPVPRQFAILFRDVTEEKRATEERERLYQAAEEANRLKDDFLATLSHELRTPLTAILGWARLLQQGGLKEETARQAHDTIARNAEAQRQLLTDVLDVARMTSGKTRLEVRELDALEVVNQAVASIRPAVDAKELDLRVTGEVSPALVTADPDRLQQIVWNLLSNAVKFTPAGGRIDVRVTRGNSTLDLVVSDTGIGLSADFLPKLFARFTQADSSPSRQHGGLGIGLSIVRHLVELHGGKVSAESAGEGKGSTFTVSLPVRAIRRRLASPPRAEHAAGEIVEAAPLLAGLHVLVVDDVEDAREMIAAVLESAGGRVTLADSADQALEQLRTAAPPDLILADIGMPGMDGYEFMRRVRALPPGGGLRIPAVALTAFGASSDRDKAMAAGFDDHVAKPVLPEELLVAVAGAAGRRT